MTTDGMTFTSSSRGWELELTENDLLIQQLRNRIADLEAAVKELEARICRWYDTCPMAEAEEEHEHI